MDNPTFIWSLYYPAPETKKWRITGVDVDGRQGLYVDVFMHCDKLRHAPGLNMCRVCQERHELPEATDQRYAYRWYPSKPSLRSVIQWNRRSWEREVKDVHQVNDLVATGDLEAPGPSNPPKHKKQTPPPGARKE